MQSFPFVQNYAIALPAPLGLADRTRVECSVSSPGVRLGC